MRIRDAERTEREALEELQRLPVCFPPRDQPLPGLIAGTVMVVDR
jgi:hypothetical protein